MSARGSVPRIVALLASLGSLGCAKESADFVELSGTLASGQPFQFKEQPLRIACETSDPCLALRALQLAGATHPLLRGLRLTFQPGQLTTGTSYAAGADAPAQVRVIQAAQADGGASGYRDAPPLSGQVTLTSLAARDGETLAGTLTDIKVYPEGKTALDADPEVHIQSGSFRYLYGPIP